MTIDEHSMAPWRVWLATPFFRESGVNVVARTDADRHEELA